jgi:hypothetical protein
MPTFTDPLPSALLDDTVAVAEDINRKIYHPSALGTADSLEGLNGEVDRTNLVTNALPLPKSKVMTGAASRSGSVGATANLDFIGDFLFPLTSMKEPLGITAWSTAKFKDQNYVDALEPVPVPGLSDTIINPFSAASRIRLSWSVDVVPSTLALFFLESQNAAKGVAWGAGGGYGLGAGTPVPVVISQRNLGSWLYLYVNGVQHPSIRIQVATGESTTRPSQNYEESPCNNTGAWNDFFHWEFSCVLDSAEVARLGLGANSPLLRGLHSASIRAWSRCRMLRFKTRSFHWTVEN